MAGTGGAPTTFKGLPIEQYLKGLDDSFVNETEQVQTYVSQLFHVQTKNQYRITKQSFSGLPQAGAWEADGDAPNLQSVSFRFNITATTAYVGNGTAYTKKLFDHQQYDIIENGPTLLNHSMSHAEAIQAASMFQGGFAAYWNTGAAEYWFTASHALDPRAYNNVGGNYSNLVTGKLNVSNLQTARRLLENTPDDMGRPGFYKASTLAIPTALEDVAIETVAKRMEYRPDSANYTPNALGQTNPGLQILVVPWFDLYSTTAWFLMDDKKKKAIWNWDVPLEKWTADDPHSKTHYQYASYAWMNWLDDWRGVVASAG
jgi:hypothetical protein